VDEATRHVVHGRRLGEQGAHRVFRFGEELQEARAVAAQLLEHRHGLSLGQLTALALEPLDLAYASALSPDKHRELLKRVAPTERDEWRGRLVRGEVHDENCAALDGVSGHAGVFGSAKGVGLFGRAILDALNGRVTTGVALLAQATLASALTARDGGTHRLGWDGKSAADSSAGRRMSASTFGHLGFTGTSIWCDPVADVVIVLLSNRVCPSRANEKIKGFRPAFHDAIMAAVAG
jgi:CubicO group peptidase (beta-lactamase class C family)